MSKHDWKPDFMERGSSATSLWYGNGRSGDATFYRLHIGTHEIYVSRGEIVATCMAGLFAGLFYAGVQTGLIHRPRPYQPPLVHYDAPKPKLLGSTENVRPADPMPRRHFVDYSGYDVHHVSPAPSQATSAAESYEAVTQAAPSTDDEADAG